ncbi:MAG: hypothetical protein ACE1Z0_09370 [Acidimicrobiia bacterium]
MRRLNRALYLLMPARSRDWGQGLLAEMEEIDDAGESTRWLLGAGQVVVRSWFKAILGGDLMKTVLATLSTINGAMGLFLIGLYVLTDSHVPIVMILALGLIIQGGYTLAHLSGRLQRFEPWSVRALLVGETVALVAGGLAFVASGLRNVAPPNGDYEYGPFVVGALIATQALVALVVYTNVSIRRSPTPSA